MNIAERAKDLKGHVGIYFKNLTTGEVVNYNADDEYHPASVIKLPIVMAVYKMASEGKADLYEKLKVTYECRVPSCGAFNAFTDDVCDIEYAIKNLREIPLDFIQFEMKNGNRKNLEFDMGQEKWGGSTQLKVALDVDERVVCNFDRNPYKLNNGNNVNANNTASFLIPYWFGRYYGLIEE